MGHWDLEQNGVRLRFGRVAEDAARRWVEEIGGLPSDDGTSAWIPLSAWAEAARLPTERDPETLDAWASRHESFGRALRLGAQNVLIESIGHLGAPELQFAVSVSGHLLTAGLESPFP